MVTLPRKAHLTPLLRRPLASLTSPRAVASRLQVHSPAASLEEAEVLEEHKIRAFIAMLEGLHSRRGVN